MKKIILLFFPEKRKPQPITPMKTVKIGDFCGDFNQRIYRLIQHEKNYFDK